MTVEEVATELDADLVAEELLVGAYLVHQATGVLETVPLHEGVSITLGRGDDVDLSIESPRVSRRHARVTLVSGHVLVEDLGSRNGTRVGGDVLRSAIRRARGGETIQVGPLELLLARADRALAYGKEDETPASIAAERPPSDLDEEEGIRSRDGVIVADTCMIKLFQVIRRVAPTSAVVLVTGETGAGKEIVAARIHAESPRAAGPYMRISCASIPGPLLESELFGHERGAFTGAERRRIGWFEAAAGGSLLLDEIGELSLELQAKLLRVLEERALARVGGTQTIAVDVRVICATHRDLGAMVAEGKFRQDLFFRITTFTLEVPPLRERPGEILLLADMFARRFAADAGVPALPIADDAVRALRAHAWPGNVRELRNAIEHGLVMAAGGRIERAHLPRSIRGETGASHPPPPSVTGMRDRMEEVERAALVEALAAENGNRTRAASRLGISRRAVIYKMIKYGLR